MKGNTPIVGHPAKKLRVRSKKIRSKKVRRNLRHNLLQSIRKKQVCTDCGECDWRIMQSDHIRSLGRKLGNVSSIMSIPDMLFELLKTQPLCAVCHEKKSCKVRRKLFKRSDRVRSPKTVRMYKKKQIIDTYKNKRGCESCEYNDPDFPSSLHFDHLDEFRHLKRANVSRLLHDGYSLGSIFDEIRICRVLCANCHAKHTRTQLGWPEYTTPTNAQLDNVK